MLVGLTLERREQIVHMTFTRLLEFNTEFHAILDAQLDGQKHPKALTSDPEESWSLFDDDAMCVMIEERDRLRCILERLIKEDEAKYQKQLESWSAGSTSSSGSRWSVGSVGSVESSTSTASDSTTTSAPVPTTPEEKPKVRHPPLFSSLSLSTLGLPLTI